VLFKLKLYFGKNMILYREEMTHFLFQTQ